jgi:shikimate kinase
VRDSQKVVLVGPMGAGKTTLGRLLAEATGWPYFDNDEEMSQRYGFSQEELASMSVPDLHALESRYLADVLAQDAPLITGAAASVVDYPDNRALLESVTTIYLKIQLSAVIARAGTTGVGRQALAENGEAILTERYARRDPLYSSVAVATLELSNNPESDAKKLISLVNN